MEIEGIAGILERHWGYSGFLPLQREAIAAALGRRDSLVVLPTGGGKSLCFQAPAVRLPGTAIVVSPLISLMKDQVDALVDRGVAAGCLHSGQTTEERDATVERLLAGAMDLVYVSPERLMTDGFLGFARRLTVSFVAVDEAHCVSMWGHDFRPEYRRLGRLKQAFPGVAIHAYTATATETVRTDIIAQLRLEDPKLLVGSFDRPNLVFSVERRTDVLRQVRDVLDRHPSESCIVYCIRRADVDDLAERLRKAGYRAAPYHAGLSDELRRSTQEAFAREEVDTIVATVAFGMGIDKSNVRAVIHAAMPKSLEHYQQESGRAGRDGLEAECVLLYGDGDYSVWKYIIEQSTVEEAVRIGRAKLGDMAAYAGGVTCRHRALVGYFGQTLEGESCGACDVCLGDLELMDDALVVSQKILSCVYRLDERFGGDYTAGVLGGSRDKRVLAAGHDRLSTYGLLAAHPKRQIRDWIEQLVAQGCLVKAGEYNVLALTERGWGAMRGEWTPRLLQAAERAAARPRGDSWKGVDRALFDRLRDLRRQIASERGVPAYIVFGDAALRDMARRRPSSVDGFLAVHGVGAAKAEQYGRRMVAAIREESSARGLAMDVDPTVRAAPKPRRRRRKGRATVDLARQLAFGRFDRGASVAAVADALDASRSVAVRYLADYLRERGAVSPEPWADRRTFSRVEEVAARIGIARPEAILRELGDTVDRDALAACIACLENR